LSNKKNNFHLIFETMTFFAVDWLMYIVASGYGIWCATAIALVGVALLISRRLQPNDKEKQLFAASWFMAVMVIPLSPCVAWVWIRKRWASSNCTAVACAVSVAMLALLCWSIVAFVANVWTIDYAHLLSCSEAEVFNGAWRCPRGAYMTRGCLTFDAMQWGWQTAEGTGLFRLNSTSAPIEIDIVQQSCSSSSSSSWFGSTCHVPLCLASCPSASIDHSVDGGFCDGVDSCHNARVDAIRVDDGASSSFCNTRMFRVSSIIPNSINVFVVLAVAHSVCSLALVALACNLKSKATDDPYIRA
jgi:hypothetical protein